jgi:acetoin:2,6-dichlorophenolindophenol oxidoreductase subunit beta
MSTPEPATHPPADAPDTERNLTIVEAMREALREEMTRDEDVFVIGEDIQIGGAFLVTLGLVETFGDRRVINTPISEAGFVGLSTGAAIDGMRPIVDFQYGDFIFTAADQLIQQATKLRYMSDGQVSIPLVVQLPTGASGRGAQHANPIESFFFNVPGLVILTPSTPYDAKGLLKAAVRDDNVVLFCVHKHLYGSKGRPLEHSQTSTGNVPAGEYLVPIGEADVKRRGDDVTVVANHVMLHRSLNVAESLAQEGIAVEVIDPRTLVPFDLETVLESVRKTGRLIAVEENHHRGGWGGWLLAEVAERALEYLDAPLRRLTLPDVPIPFSPPLESAVLPGEDDIGRVIREVVAA